MIAAGSSQNLQGTGGLPGGIQGDGIHIGKAGRAGLQPRGPLQRQQRAGQIATAGQGKAGAVLQLGTLGQAGEAFLQDGRGCRLVAPGPDRVRQVGPPGAWRDLSVLAPMGSGQ